MAIKIGSNFSYKGELFLDSRQSVASLAELGTDPSIWKAIYPVGHRICIGGIWYTYRPDLGDEKTGGISPSDPTKYFYPESYTSGLDAYKPVVDARVSNLEVKDTIHDAAISQNTTQIEGLGLALEEYKGEVEGTYQKKIVPSQDISISQNNSLLININSGDKILSRSSTGLSAELSVTKLGFDSTGLFSSQYKLTGIGGVQIGETINIPKDLIVISARYISHATPEDVARGGGTVILNDPYLEIVFHTQQASPSPWYVFIPAGVVLGQMVAGAGLVINDNTISINLANDSSTRGVYIDSGGLHIKTVNSSELTSSREYQDYF